MPCTGMPEPKPGPRRVLGPATCASEDPEGWDAERAGTLLFINGHALCPEWGLVTWGHSHPASGKAHEHRRPR